MATDAPEEIEFKFQVPAQRAKAVLEALGAAGPLAVGPVTVKRLAARYFDTPDDRLAAVGLSLRLRQESGRWVQTLKMNSGSGNLKRAEHEVDVGAAGSALPVVDLERHRDTFAGQAAQAALDGTEPPADGPRELVERFRTKVQRHSLEVDWLGSRIELSFDRGRIETAAANLAVCEFELELKHGGVDALADLAECWVRAHGLWLAAESKSDRGHRLARNEPAPQVVKAQRLEVRLPVSADGFARAAVANALAQAFPNMSAIASGSDDDEHVHQLRVGLRRIRTLLREFRGLSPDLPIHTEASVATVFRRLGADRDRRTVLESMKPRLLEAGAVSVAWADTAPAPERLALLVQDASFQSAMISLAGFALAPQRGEPQGRASLRRSVRPRLRRLHRQVTEGGERFETLTADRQHRVRKRLKSLRYLVEFVGGLFDRDEVDRYLKRLEPAQDRLGTHNDAAVAREAASESASSDPGARFAVDWLDGRHRKVQRKSRQALRAVARAKHFWARE